MSFPQISLPVTDAATTKKHARRNSTEERARVFLDAKALRNLATIRSFAEHEFGATLSTSMAIRLALFLAANRCASTPPQALEAARGLS
jgi:hypothetical protein